VTDMARTRGACRVTGVAGRPRQGSRGGYTLLELAIASLIALLVVLALGRLIVANLRSWEWGRDKVVLQQNVTEALEWMERSVRAAHTLQVPANNSFITFDETGAQVHTYHIEQVAGRNRLREDNHDLSDRPCTLFTVSANWDTTSLLIRLEFEDAAGDRVAATTRATIRNRPFEF
jgi:hypothetical protein